MKDLIIDNEEAMVGAGKMLGSTTKPGDVFALVGDLGTGKTHFTKGLVHGAGCESSVTSPTFPLLHEYLQGKFPIYHFDFYRVERAEEILHLGWDDLVEESGSILAVEWASRFPELLPEEALRVNLQILPGEARRVTRVT